MHNGFITIHRKIVDWEWYSDLPTKTLFLHLLLTANFEDKKWRGITIKRGQKLTSLPSLAEETGLSVQQVRTAIKKLISTCEATDKPTSKNRLITITKYDDYQDINRQTNRLATDNQQTINRQSTATKEYNNLNNDNKVTNNIKKTKAKKSFEIPEGIRKEVWDGFEEMRKLIKKPMTDHARNLVIKKLVKINQDSGCDPNAVLDQSTQNSWQGVFALKKNQNGGNGYAKNNSGDYIEAAAEWASRKAESERLQPDEDNAEPDF